MVSRHKIILFTGSQRLEILDFAKVEGEVPVLWRRAAITLLHKTGKDEELMGYWGATDYKMSREKSRTHTSDDYTLEAIWLC